MKPIPFAVSGLMLLVSLHLPAQTTLQPLLISSVVPPGNVAYVLGHGTGTGSYAWSTTESVTGLRNSSRLDAILLNGNLSENITHYLCPWA